jgi:hypothetical protein
MIDEDLGRLGIRGRSIPRERLEEGRTLDCGCSDSEEEDDMLDALDESGDDSEGRIPGDAGPG